MAEQQDIINSKKAVNFLKHFRNEGMLNLVSIDPHSKNIEGITRPVGHKDLLDFIMRNNGKRNLYFMVNEPKSESQDDKTNNGKLKKTDIDYISAVWVDADPDKTKPFDDERKRLLNLADETANSNNPPTYIVDSGGGIQMFWLLDKHVKADSDTIKHYEALSRSLSYTFETDRVHNIDRIMRIPFTLNIPDAKKKKTGRKPTYSKVIHAKSPKGIRYNGDLTDFITPIFAAEAETDTSGYELDLRAVCIPMPENLLKRFNASRKKNKKIDDLWNNRINKASRSERDFTLTKELKWDNYTLEEVATILWNFPHGKNKDLTKREIIRCYARVENPFEALSAEQINAIEQQTNPLKAEQFTFDNDDEQPKRLKGILAGTSTWALSGTYLVKKMIDEQTITVMYGASNVGKSFVATDLAGHVAAGQDWGEHKVKEKAGVLYIAAEAGHSYGRRLHALKERLAIEHGASAKDFPFMYVAMGVDFLKNKKDIKDVVLLSRQLEKMSGVKTKLVVVDTLATTFAGGNENSSEDMGEYITNMKLIQEHAKTAVIVVHHSGKDAAAGARGHSSLRAATDTELEVIAEKRGERYERAVKTRKQRDGESDTSLPFGLNVITLGQDEDGDDITTCHVVLENDSEFDSVVPSPEDGLNDKSKLALDAIDLYDAAGLSEGDIRGWTEKQVKTIIYNDLEKANGVFSVGNPKTVTGQITMMSKPSRTMTRDFERQCEKLFESGFVMERPNFKRKT